MKEEKRRREEENKKKKERRREKEEKKKKRRREEEEKGAGNFCFLFFHYFNFSPFVSTQVAFLPSLRTQAGHSPHPLPPPDP
jgi:hypothetical protein